jgi:hypothetical protein
MDKRMKKEDRLLSLRRDDTVPAPHPSVPAPHILEVKVKRTHRATVVLTKQEYDNLENKLERRQSLSDYIRNALKESGHLD